MLETLSKTMSYYLRHKPQELGISLDSQGWVDVDTFLQKLQEKGVKALKEDLENVVKTDSKGRYSLLENKIRANQGHTTKSVNLKFKKELPPFILYHGTSSENWDKIKSSGGLKSMDRHYVHLSANEETATQVGLRKKGTLVILKIEARRMMADGTEYFLSENGVWLTKEVSLKYIKE